MASCNSQWTSIFGRLDTRKLGTVISTISSVAWPSQGSLELSGDTSGSANASEYPHERLE
jgi:hypothetical protein